MVKHRFDANFEHLQQCILNQRNGIDENGVNVWKEYPHRLTLEVLKKKCAKENTDFDYKEVLDWLDNTYDPNSFKRIWVDDLYFKDKGDAALFKLRWY